MIAQTYEIQTPGEAEKCMELGVDHLGSVILEQSQWRVPLLRETVQITEHTPAKSSMIPLFRDLDTVCRCLDYYRPDFIHFCDALTDETGHLLELESFVDFQATVKEKFPEIGIIRTIPIPRFKQIPDFPTLKIDRAFEAISDFFLTDTWVKDAPVDGFVGITGKTVDPEIAAGLVRQNRIPVILAGGLSPENVHDALMEIHAAGADSCTLTNRVDPEGNPVRFEKDFQKVAKFVKQVRNVETILNEEKSKLLAQLEQLRAELADREKALPAHSVRPHQMMVIEELEDQISALEKEIEALGLRG